MGDIVGGLFAVLFVGALVFFSLSLLWNAFTSGFRAGSEDADRMRQGKRPKYGPPPH